MTNMLPFGIDAVWISTEASPLSQWLLLNNFNARASFVGILVISCFISVYNIPTFATTQTMHSFYTCVAINVFLRVIIIIPILYMKNLDPDKLCLTSYNYQVKR